MEAELKSKQAMMMRGIAGATPPTAPAAPTTAPGEWRAVTFSVAHARRALPYITRLAREAADAFAIVQRCRSNLPSASGDRRTALCEQRDRALQRLNIAIDDCNAAGAHLVDLAAGRVGFLSEIAGRPVSLLWDLDEPIDSAWNEL